MQKFRHVGQILGQFWSTCPADTQAASEAVEDMGPGYQAQEGFGYFNIVDPEFVYVYAPCPLIVVPLNIITNSQLGFRPPPLQIF